MANTKTKKTTPRVCCYLTLYDYMNNNPSPCGKANPEPTSGEIKKVTCGECLAVFRDRLKEDMAKIDAVIKNVGQRLDILAKAKRKADGNRR